MDSRSSHSYSSSQSSGLGRRLSAAPQPLTYRELAKGALYNAAQPLRHERPPVHSMSIERLHLHSAAHDSAADLASGHLYNPTSSVHEVDPPTWPAHGMENVPASNSPFKSYRVERPRSPPRAKPLTTVYKGKRPNHQTVASGALYNPYIPNRLPDALQPPDEPALVRRSTTKSSRLYEPAPRVPLRVPVVADTRSELSAYRNGSVQGENTNTHVFPGGNPRSSVHFANGAPSPHPSPSHSRASSLRGQDAWANPDPGAFGTTPARARTASDDTIYYHPSREASMRQVPPPVHNPDAHRLPPSAHPSRAPSAGGGGSAHALGSRPSSALMRPAPWMDQEAVVPAAFASVHPASPTAEAAYLAHSRTASVRGPSSLHHELAGPVRSVRSSRAPSALGGSHHFGGDAQSWHAPSINGGGSQHFGDAQGWHTERASSVNGGGSQHWGDAPGGHASRAPSVNGGGSQHAGAPPGSYHSRAPSVNGGGSQHFNDALGAHPSQVPTVIRDSREFDDGEGAHNEGWGSGGQAWGQGDGDTWGGDDAGSGGGGGGSGGSGGEQAWGQGDSWGGGGGGAGGDFAEAGAEPGEHVLSHHPSRASTIKGGSVKGGSLRGAPSVPSFRAPSAAATHVSRFQEQNGIPPSRAPSAASHRTAQIQQHIGGGPASRAATPVFELPAVYDALPEEAEEATLVGAGESVSTPEPVPSAHPSRASSVVAGSQHSPAPSVAVPSRAPSRATMTDAPLPTLTRRGKASKLGRGGGRGGRATPAPVAVSDYDNIQISVVQPTPTE